MEQCNRIGQRGYRAHISPAVVMAIAAVGGFYGTHVYEVPFPYAFFGAVQACVLCIGCLLVRSGVRFFSRWGAVRIWRRWGIAYTSVCRCCNTLFFVFCGLCVACVARTSLMVQQAPLQTLAQPQKLRVLTIHLLQEQKPAGTRFRVRARVLGAGYIDGASFSARGVCTVLFPAEVILQQYATDMTDDADARVCQYYARGLRCQIRGRFASSAPKLFISSSTPPRFVGWSSYFAQMRAQMRVALMRFLSPWGRAGGLLLALLSADSVFLSDEMRVAFRHAGLAHVLALSGMHLSLVGASATFLGRFIGTRHRGMQGAFFAMLVFVWFAGISPSLARALGMTLVLMGGQMAYVRVGLFSVLCAVLSIHMLIAPHDVQTLSFMLSYGALAGIVLLGSEITEMMSGLIPRPLASLLGTSCSAQFFTAPIVLSVIGYFAPIGVLASCVVSPLIALFLIGGSVALCCSLAVPAVAPFLSWGVYFFGEGLCAVVRFFACAPLVYVQSACGHVCAALFSFLLGGGLLEAARRVRVHKDTYVLPEL